VGCGRGREKCGVKGAVKFGGFGNDGVEDGFGHHGGSDSDSDRDSVEPADGGDGAVADEAGGGENAGGGGDASGGYKF
jgi:hypothetical protein